MRLIISEKPSVGAVLASVLGAKEHKDGYFIGNGWIVSWCLGHLVEQAPAEAYNERYGKWLYSDLPIIPEKWKQIAAKGKTKQLTVLRELMNSKDVNSIVCAADAGREGEHIFRLVYEYFSCKKPVERLWISSIEDSAIREGLKKLRPSSDYDNLYCSALCRSRADWLVGVNNTRLFSCLYGDTLNVGRVQSPTLALIVNREALINDFKSVPFYTPEIDCGGFSALGEKMSDLDAAEAVRSAVDGKDAVCLSVKKQEKTVAPPKLYDLTTLQREANRYFGFTAQQTLDYAQSLYEKKLITYPRSDSKYISSDMEAGIPSLISGVEKAFPYLKSDTKVKIKQIVNDKGITDHHAVLPTRVINSTDLSALPAGEYGIMQMLSARLICSVAPAHRFEAVTAIVECCDYRFTATGRNSLFDGWKTIDNAFRAAIKGKPDTDEECYSALPDIKEGQKFASVSADIKEGKTSPPRRFTEDTLLSAMETAGAEDMPEDSERKGLGTPATRAGIIEKLIKAGFVERSKRNLLPTKKGINLVTVLPSSLTSAKLTAEWEYKLKQIENGELADKVFLSEIGEFVKSIIVDNNAPKDEFISLFPDTRKHSAAPVGMCPRCGSPVREGKKGFFCDKQTCGFKIWSNNRFWTAKKMPLTSEIVATLLKDGYVKLKGLYSEKSGKLYDATVVLDDTGDGYVNFKLKFGKR